MAYIGVQPADAYTSFAVQHFTTSATTSYTLDNPVANENEIALFINNVRQEPGSGYAYTASGTTLTLSAATSASDTMYCVFIGKAVQTVTPANGSVTNDMLAGSISPSKVSNLYPYRNLIINGDMSIAQRGTSSTGQTSNGYYTIDRFRQIISGIGTWTFSQSTDVPSGQGFAYSQKWNCTTADASPASTDQLLLQYRFEGQMLQSMKKGTSNAESVPLSFWVKTKKTGTYIIELFDRDNTRTISKSYTVNSSSTWEKKTITIEGDTTGTFDNDNNASLDLHFWLGAGSNNTSGTLQTTWGTQSNADRAVGQVNLADSTSNEWYITGVQLEVGTSASDFEFLPYDVNLLRCQRYFQKGYSDADNAVHAGRGQGTTAVDFHFSLVTPLRASPTITQSGTGWRVFKPSSTLSDSSSTPTVARFYELNPYIVLRHSGHSGITDNYLFGISPNSLTYYFDSEL